MTRAFNLMNPFDFFSLGMQQHKLTLAAAETIWHRSSLYSRGALTPAEALAMCVEKPTALAKGFEKGAMAMVGGKPPAEVIAASMAPITAKAASNAKRLRR